MKKYTSVVLDSTGCVYHQQEWDSLTVAKRDATAHNVKGTKAFVFGRFTYWDDATQSSGFCREKEWAKIDGHWTKI